MREVAFAHKQRAIRQALQMGEQIARRRAHAALAAAFTAWRIQVGSLRAAAPTQVGPPAVPSDLTAEQPGAHSSDH